MTYHMTFSIIFTMIRDDHPSFSIVKQSLTMEYYIVFFVVQIETWCYQYKSSRPEVFLGKCVRKICSKFTGEHPCRSAISIKLQRHTSAWVFSCKFAAYSQKTFSEEHLWTVASVSIFNGFRWLLDVY